MNITLTDYVIAMLFLKKYPSFNSFYVQNLLLSPFSQFLECEAKICKFLVNFVIFYIFVTALSPRNNIFWYTKKILKNKDVHNASLACIIESVPKNLILLCEIWVLTPSFFGTPLRSHYPIFSPQIKQENLRTRCSMKIQNY